ncbi:cytochrome c5 family protein [Rubrivivax gelatinosus]|uniref:Cytochrome c5 family protein n=1 Tax=Rubrivivax gelatinosus TaxID=28068 RepID=A0ABS1DWD2_RUBGE|nr:c-type cytochrome [Rubrivivax gelatinosus]MBK1613421.1 cytochrome c5 family protein [Rubrivivax gelatinosus]MBK1714297.1 cytochrome c5 family protein [Rubrivivax gelatinosus]
MTDDHDTPAAEGPIKTPKQLAATVVAAFLVPITLLLLVAGYFGAQPRTGAGSDAFDEHAVALRLQPVGRVALRDAPAGNAEPRTGEQVYQAVCGACHTNGTLGAPKHGDKAAWAPRIAQGFDALLHSALKGKNAMPPQGGGATSDYEIARAVVYMANDGGAKFAEPPAPAASAAN